MSNDHLKPFNALSEIKFPLYLQNLKTSIHFKPLDFKYIFELVDIHIREFDEEIKKSFLFVVHAIFIV